MKKLSQLRNQEDKQQEYIQKYGTSKVQEIMKTKLNMWDIGNNIGKKRKCICGEGETIQHISECADVTREIGVVDVITGEWEERTKEIRRYIQWMKNWEEL